MAYVDEGSGPNTLLFIHGLANYALVWKKNIETLKQHFRCIAIDLPGNGLSDKNEHDYSMRFYADAVHDFINALKLQRVTIVGHSMGGQVAMTLLLNYPACAEKLVLCAPAGFEEFSTLDKTLYTNSIHLMGYFSSDENALRHIIESSFFRQHTQGESIVRELSGIMKTYKLNAYRKMVDASIRCMLDEPVHHRLQEINVPVLVIYGVEDALIPNRLLHHTTTGKLAEAAVKKFPLARLVMIPDCGHFVQLEKADEVSGLIAAFAGE